METGNVNQEFNIAEILRYAPKMLELFSPIYGEVYFDYVNEEGTDIRVKTKLCGGSVATFNANGTFYDLPNSECLLFPSTHCRNWNHWQNTLFLESIGSVCVDTITGNKYILEKSGTFFTDGTGSGYSTLIDGEDSGNYLLNSRYATPEETNKFFEDLSENGYYWSNEKQVVQKIIKYLAPKFKEGDVIKHTPTGEIAIIKHICSDYYVLDKGTSLYFESQDMWELVASKVKPTLKEKVNILADEIIALKQRVLALEIQVIKDMSTPPLTKAPILYPDKVTCDDAQCYKGKSASDAFKTPDKAGDCVTLKDMKS